MANIIALPYEYFADPNKGRPLFNAQIYIGVADTDPLELANRVDVFYVQEDGTEVIIQQPIRTSSGGLTVNDSGDVVQIRTANDYSMRVFDRGGAEIVQYNIPNNAETGGATIGFVNDRFNALSSVEVTAAGTTTPRTLGTRFTDTVNVKDFESLVVGGDWGAAILAACNLGVSISSPVVMQGSFSVSSVTIPPNTVINSSCEILCLADNITVTIQDSVQINGSFTVNGNSIRGEAATVRVLVSGDDVFVDRIFLNDISSDLNSGEAITYGCTVTGDNFKANLVESSFGGYSPLRLLITKDISSFSVQRIRSIDYWFKGFVVNGSAGNCESIFIDDFYAEYNDNDDATDGFLVDTNNDATITNIESLVVNKLEAYGGEANGYKVQNVKHCHIGYLKTRLAGGVNNPRFGFTMAARYCQISHVDVDWFLTVFSQELNITYLNTVFSPSADRVIQLTDPYWRDVEYSYDFGHISARFDADDSFKVIRFESDNSQTYYANIGHLSCIADPISIGNIPPNGQQGNIIKIDKLTGYTGQISTGSSAKDRLIQLGEQPQRVTAANVQDISHQINTVNKAIGKSVFITDTFETVFAAQTSAGATWRDANGNTVYTPS